MDSPTAEELKRWKEALEKKAKEAKEKQQQTLESQPDLIQDHIEVD